MNLTDYDNDPKALFRAFSLFPTGVAALSAVFPGDDGHETPVVMVASSFQVGISADPPLVLVAVQHASSSWPRLRTAARIGVSVLGEGHDIAARQLASKAADRFAGLNTHRSASGAYFIDEAPVWLECSIHEEVTAGDHDVVLLRVHALATRDDLEPLVWHSSGFRSLSPRGGSTTGVPA